ncbi:hypothetical protein [Pseudomonas sp. GM80]|uniref:hypothetical protein n=1 Tax=Pseudomonas sp. GM80 TaxID=1144339 RepID=UPI00026FC830|nr:hypothetical protein [Pseudomonas sp. GM80]EJN34330.1 hypothetical protein PMI37_01190 [Pseudomonas sp. GM80]
MTFQRRSNSKPRFTVMRSFAIALTATLTFSLANAAFAAQQLPKVPTTKIIAIGSLTPTATPDAVSAVLPEEVRETVKLSLAGKIEQWNVRTDKSGVVFVLNVTDVSEARDMFAKMPLDKAGLMTFEFIPVGPLSPLALLLDQPAH